MNNEQSLQNLTMSQLSLGTGTKFEANRSGTTGLTPSALALTLSKWQPMGIRVVVDLPYTPDLNQPLFAIRVTPTWFSLREWTAMLDDNTTKNFSRYFSHMPIFVPYTGGIAGPVVPEDTKDTPVRVSYYGDSPPIAKYSRIHRFNAGSIKYQIVTTPGSVTHGYFQYSVVRGVGPPGADKPVDYRLGVPTYAPEFSSTYDNFVNIKPSTEGFIELDVPRVSGNDVKDSAMDLYSFNSMYDPNGYDYIMVYLKGTLSSLSQTQMAFEFNIAAGPDFVMNQPLPVSTNKRNFWTETDLFTEANPYYLTIYSNPGLTFPSALKKYRDLFKADGSLVKNTTYKGKKKTIGPLGDDAGAKPNSPHPANPSTIPNPKEKPKKP